VKPLAGPCRIPREQVEQARISAPDGDRTYGPVTARQVRAVEQAEQARLTGAG
jgi:hypothetical protein